MMPHTQGFIQKYSQGGVYGVGVQTAWGGACLYGTYLVTKMKLNKIRGL